MNQWLKTSVFLLCSTGLFSNATEESKDCKANFAIDLSQHLIQKQASEQTLSFDCGVQAGCDAYFDIAMEEGSELYLNLCGSVDWPTAISVWSGPGYQENVTCKTPSCTTIFVAPRDDLYRIRINGIDDASGVASLTLKTSAKTQLIGAPAPVPTLNEYGLMILVLGLGFIGLKMRS